MSGYAKILSLGLLWSAAAGIAAGQEPAPSTAQPAAAQAAAHAATTVTKPVNTSAQAEAGEPRADTSQPAAPAVPAAPAAAPATAKGPAKGAPKPPNGVDRLDLGTATVTGDREQPKVMYIVPWKKSDIGDMGGKPMNSLLDEVLAPVDREVFRRQVDYYGVIKADASQNGASKPPANQGEK
jgi:hypothetical protein